MAKFSYDVVVLLVVLAGLISHSAGMDPATIVAIAKVAGIVISSGASMMSKPKDYSVVCSIEVENWTRFILEDPHSSIAKGQLQSSPVVIRPASREKIIAHEASWFRGTYGVASWLLNDRRAAVMWHCPYSFFWGSKNMLGVGLTESWYGYHKNWFYQMYKGGNGQGLNFVRDDYYYDTPTIRIADERFEITGTMGTSHKATARIVIRPVNEHDLAPSIAAELDKRGLAKLLKRG
ncbi:echotoxin-2-like isoform X2 [Mytilus californianus]|nr:echotoxin-2-like isoform X2 [Mytilus californianus]